MTVALSGSALCCRSASRTGSVAMTTSSMEDIEDSNHFAKVTVTLQFGVPLCSVGDKHYMCSLGTGSHLPVSIIS